MNDILSPILQTKKKELAQAKSTLPITELRSRVKDCPPCRDFFAALTKSHPRGLNVIAEIKRASPSAGLIRPDFKPDSLAQIYQAAGADAISVLTDEHYFQGKLQYLELVKNTVSLPVLRKDFIIDPYQILEARAAGADAVLLIAEALTTDQLTQLLESALSLDLAVLLEVHEPQSLQRIRHLIENPQHSRCLLGINNRNLKTMKTDLDTSLQLGKLITNKKILVAESGIKSRPDVRQLIAANFNAVLIGETLMRSHDITQKFNELFGI